MQGRRGGRFGGGLALDSALFAWGAGQSKDSTDAWLLEEQAGRILGVACSEAGLGLAACLVGSLASGLSGQWRRRKGQMRVKTARARANLILWGECGFPDVNLDGIRVLIYIYLDGVARPCAQARITRQNTTFDTARWLLSKCSKPAGASKRKLLDRGRRTCWRTTLELWKCLDALSIQLVAWEKSNSAFSRLHPEDSERSGGRAVTERNMAINSNGDTNSALSRHKNKAAWMVPAERGPGGISRLISDLRADKKYVKERGERCAETHATVENDASALPATR